ncbi:hypothetical protein K505DRAFT_367128 [Melanomma pulvis-pyrius CBS 109.77]|uniref:Uncharacterized protein n=1 Tax=Melanomma pulvis-pyrius CBS 109.77 TaxID=1314802 RepID=A0A6A6WUC3_9PLEO|nr:hypothetical protein K505DRAFT_367128 [Melanomma pulvis-pyrius CBS 109.77]
MSIIQVTDTVAEMHVDDSTPTSGTPISTPCMDLLGYSCDPSAAPNIAQEVVPEVPEMIPISAVFPPEIRNPIFDYILTDIPSAFCVHEDVMKENSLTDSTDSMIQPFLYRLHRLADFDHLAYYECASVLVARSSFEISYEEDMIYFETFLLTLPQDCGFARVSELHFPRFSQQACTWARANEIMDFCYQMPNLAEVSITIFADTALQGNPPIQEGEHLVFHNSPLRLRPLHEVAAALELGQLAHLPSLKKLTIICDFRYALRRVPIGFALDIGIWLAVAAFGRQPTVRGVRVSWTDLQMDGTVVVTLDIFRR